MSQNYNYSDFDIEINNEKTQEGKIVSSESKPNFYITRGIKDIFNLFLLSKWLVLSICATIIFSTTIYQYLLSPRYQTSMLLELTKPDTQDMPQMGFIQKHDDKEVRIGNLLTLIKSRFIMGEVFEEIKKDENVDFELDDLSPQIDVESLPNTDLLKLVVSDSHPVRAKYLADSIVKLYFKQTAKKSSMMHAQALEVLTERIEQSKNTIADMEAKIINFYKDDKKFAFANSQGTDSIISKKAASIIELISQNEIQLIVIQNKVETLSKLLKEEDVLSAIYSGFTTPKVQKLFNEHIDLEASRISLEQNFKKQHPKIQEILLQQKRLDNSILSGLSELADSFKREIVSLKNSNISLKNQLNGLKSKMIDQNTQDFDRLNLERELEISKKINQLLVQRQKELELANSQNEQEFIVIEEAQVPTAHYYPRRLRAILISFIISVIISFIIIILSDFFSPQVLSTNDVERIAKAPVLKVLSIFKRENKIIHNNTLMVFKDLTGHGAEAFRHLRSKIEYRLKPNTKTLLVTSANESDGKTFIAINIAHAFSLKKKRVLLVDADLRKATLSKVFKDLNPHNLGLSDVLGKREEFKNVVVKTLMHDLDIMFAGERVAYPSELLASDAFHTEFLNKAKQEYDLIIVDSTKAYLLSDPMIISGFVDNILIVASHGSNINDVYYTAHAMREAEGNVIGCVLNKMRFGPRQQASYYYY